MDAGPSGDDSPAAKYLWAGFGPKGATIEQTRIAAASLIGTFSGSEEAIKTLLEARQSAKNSLDRGNLDLALCQAYTKAKRWSDLLPVAKRLSETYAVADKSFLYVIRARAGLKQWTELEQDARAELKSKPENDRALLAAASAMIRIAKLDKAGEYVPARKIGVCRQGGARTAGVVDHSQGQIGRRFG